MPTTIEQFKQAFAATTEENGGLKQRDQAVSAALMRLKQSIDQRPAADTTVDQLSAALKKLVGRYDAVRKQGGHPGMDSATELDKILHQTGHVMAWADEAPSDGSAGGPQAAPAPPADGKGSPAGAPDQTPPDAAGDAAAHTSKPLRRGAQGPAVSFLQEQLNDEGAGLEVDGIFGRQTLKAVIAFQKTAGVDEKGVVGPLTWQALLKSGTNGIDIDAAVTQARELQTQFEQAKDPALKGQLARKLLAIAKPLERRLGRAQKDGDGRPKLTGQVQWEAASTGAIGDIAPFGVRDQWAAASAASPPPRVRKPPRPKTLEEELQGRERKDGEATLIVEVLDSKSGRPIQGATVSFDGLDEYLTKEDGRVRVTLKAPLTWKIRTSAPGYQTLEESYEAVEKDAALRKTRLVPKDPATLDKVVMTIAVVDRLSGAKVPKAKVALEGLSGLTDADGAGAQFHVLPGNYGYSVTAQGYQKEKGRLNVPESKDQEFHDVKVWPQTALGNELKDWELADGVAPLIIEVLDSRTGRPIQGAPVRIAGGETFTTDQGGRVRVNVKAPDSTKIEVSVPGYENGQDSFPVEEKRGQLRTVRLVPKDAAKLTKTLMEITIVNQFDGSKVQNAKVTVGRDSQVTDRDGLVNLVLLPGIHPINVTANGYHKEQTRITVPEFDVTGSNAAERREITIRPQGALGEEMQGWELEDGTAALIIEVLDAQSGKPIQGATVRFDDGDTFATEKDGRLRKSVPAPKSWKIEVAAPGYRSGQDSFTVEEKRGQIRTVRLAPVDAAKVDKVLLAITIMDMGDGSFVQNAKVTVGRASGITDAKGLVKLRVLPGIHAFSANAKGYVKESRPLDVPESKEKQEMLIAIRPSGGADIFVRVLRSGSRVPINKASVKLSSQYEYTNSNGEARFLKMPFGEHSLVVQADGYKKQLKLINHSKQSPASDFTEIELEPN